MSEIGSFFRSIEMPVKLQRQILLLVHFARMAGLICMTFSAVRCVTVYEVINRFKYEHESLYSSGIQDEYSFANPHEAMIARILGLYVRARVSSRYASTFSLSWKVFSLGFLLTMASFSIRMRRERPRRDLAVRCRQCKNLDRMN